MVKETDASSHMVLGIVVFGLYDSGELSFGDDDGDDKHKFFLLANTFHDGD